MAAHEEVPGEQEADYGETGDGEADDEEGDGEEDGEVSQQAGEVDSSSERTQSASMSNRSESKPYSSVTHECEVRNITLGSGGKSEVAEYMCSL